MAEHNLIQAPELLQRLAKTLGMRQPHIAPALNEGLQAVVIVADLSIPPQQSDIHSFRGFVSAGGDNLTLFGTAGLFNPVGNNYNLHVRRFWLDRRGAAGTFEIECGSGTSPFLLPIGGSSESADSRYRGKPTALLLGKSFAEIPIITYDFIIDPTMTPFLVVPQQLVIVPGTGFLWQDFTSPAGTVNVNVEWDEIPLVSAL